MHKALRRLPSLDFLKGFEAAGRLLSFTRAAEELFVTQSALSRQVQALEEALGVALFLRRHRALALTPAGAAFHRDVVAALTALAAAADVAHGAVRAPGVTLSTTVSFASLWVIPRLSNFRARHPATEVYISADDRLVDLSRGEVDVAVRYLPDSKAPEGSVRLFGERMLPVVAPKLAPSRRHAARKARRPRASRAPASRRRGRPHAVARMERVARLQRAARIEACRRAALQALRSSDPGRRQRAGRRARPRAADRGVSARPPARGAVSKALRFRARLLRGRRAARGGAPRCLRIRRLACR